MAVEYQDLIRSITTPSTEQRCVGCETPVSEIKKFWKYTNTPFGLKPLCIDCAIKNGISLI